jgi:agmatine deiminase
VQKRYVEIIAALATSEDVNLAVRDAEKKRLVSALLKRSGVDLRRVHFHVWDYADVWFRDYGPTFVVNRDDRKLAIVQWRFNAWGGKYPPLLKDGNVPYFISERLGLPLYMPGIILEGGAIEVNGSGALLTTEQCLLNPNRNAGLSKADTEKYLRDFLAVRDIVWLKRGLVGDDTDGHIDNLARFVGPRTVVCAYEENPADENYQALNENYEVLRRSFDVIKLPMPAAIRDVVRGEATRLAASYTNFYIGNSVVLMPAFKDSNDEVVREILTSLFPNRTVLPIDCSDIIYGAGTLHCITQQHPAVS